MNDHIMKVLGFGDVVKKVKEGKCPPVVGCGKVIKISEFKDPLSLKEYQISGLCQKCQDAFFGGSIK